MLRTLCILAGLICFGCNGPQADDMTLPAPERDAAGSMDSGSAAAPSPAPWVDAGEADGVDAQGVDADAAGSQSLDADRVASDAADPLDTGAPGHAPRTSLVLPERWLPLIPADDPFADRPALTQCAPTALMHEELSGERVYSVDTGACHYLTAGQATLHPVAAGDLLKVRLWHFALSAPEPAEAHAAVLLDDLTVMDERVTIPAPGGLIVRQLRVQRAVPAGTPVYFHLHNHGDNSWSLVEVSAGP